jgi:glycosyltransferase involved in cell wall biosynthesis
MKSNFRLIHIITTISRGGAENHLLELAAQQARNGIEVYVIPLKGDLGLLKSFRASGIEVIDSICNEPFFQQIFMVKRVLKELNPTIVHAHLPRAELLVNAIRYNSKLVISRHNTENFHPKWPRLISVSLSRVATSRADRVIMISNAVKNELERRREISKSAKISVVYYGIKKENFVTISASAEIEEKIKKLKATNTFVILTVARLAPQKDIPTLLRAFQLFKKKFPNTVLLVAGEGSDEHNLRELSVILGLEDSVDWLGKIENPVALMRKTDVFVLTSLYEGFGLVLLEAMIAETPIIAANNSAIPEVLGQKYEGLFETRNIEDLLEKLVKFTEYEERLKANESTKARLELFSADRMFRETMNVYESVVNT